MDIQTVEITRIKPATYNPRKDLQPGDPEYLKLKKSILEFDMVEPLIWNKRTGNLVGGHQRLKILREMGVKSIEVSVVDLEEVKEKALNLALNKISGEWDYPSLKDLLEELDTGAFDMEITGFDTKEIEELMSQFHEPEPGLTDEDAVPEATEAICRRGDLWQLGNHRLLCGDTTLKADIDTLLAGESARLMVTDPPYGVNYETHGKNPKWRKDGAPLANDGLELPKERKLRISYARGGTKVENDNLEGEQVQFWVDGFKNLPLDGDAYVFCPSGPNNLTLALAVEEAGITQHQWLIWIKHKLVMGRGHYHYRHEHIFYGWKGKSSWRGSRKEDSIFEYTRPDKSPDHPTMKPVALLESLIVSSSRTGQVVLDTFGGSGSTLIACEKLGRRCFMMEIDEHYCDVIIKRWEDYTGKEAVRI